MWIVFGGNAQKKALTILPEQWLIIIIKNIKNCSLEGVQQQTRQSGPSCRGLVVISVPTAHYTHYITVTASENLPERASILLPPLYYT